jgi:hypothetical protein
MIKYVALSDCVMSDQLNLSEILINSQLNSMDLDSVTYKRDPPVSIMSV